jgi:transcriptional regulator with XRE-family HTH domain
MKDVAQAIGVPASTYRDWEYGKAIKGEPYGKLAEFYGVRVDELLGGKMTELSEILVPLLEAREKIEEALKIARSLK